MLSYFHYRECETPAHHRNVNQTSNIFVRDFLHGFELTDAKVGIWRESYFACVKSETGFDHCKS